MGDPTVGRMAIDKQFHGDMQGRSKGQMLAVGTAVVLTSTALVSNALRGERVGTWFAPAPSTAERASGLSTGSVPAVTPGAAAS